MYYFQLNILHFAILMLLSEIVSAGGSGPVLIKMAGDKKGKKKGGGNLILISGGKCSGPTLIKGGGGDKKGGGEQMILVGGQGHCEEKKQVHVVKQLVPVPYYVPKPVYKYILRHHYVPVKQYIMKPVPVPYPMKSYSKSSYGGGSHDSGYSGGGSSYGSDSSSSYGSSSGYDSDSSSKYGGGYNGGNNGGSSDGYGMNYDDPNGAGSEPNGQNSMAAGYKRQSYDSTPYPISPQQSMMMDDQGQGVVDNGGGPNDYQNGLSQRSPMGSYKAAATNSYYFESPTSSYGQSYSSFSPSNHPSSSMNYPLYAPVYSGPNGQYYTTNQVFNDTNGVGASTSNLISPSASSSSYGTISVQPTAIESDSNTSHLTGVSSSSSHTTSSLQSSPHDFQRLQQHSSSSLDRSSPSSLVSTFSSKKIRSKTAKMDLERTKKLLTDPFSSLG